MGAVLDIRATEMAKLRDKNRRLRRQLSEIEEIIHDNDAMVLLMHRLSLLLIGRAKNWQGEAELLLRRGMKAAGCRIIVMADNRAVAQLSGRISRLPAGGRAEQTPLVGTADADAVYYHLPLKQGRKVLGAVIFSMRQATHLRPGDDDFCRRLAALLAAAL